MTGERVLVGGSLAEVVQSAEPPRALAAVRSMLAGRFRTLGVLALLTVVGGLAEAGFLVLVTRAAFAVAEGEELVDVPWGSQWSTDQLLLLALGLVVGRVAIALVGNRLAARLSNEVVADVRTRLARAFLRSSWSVQQSDRSGKLQELLTTFASGATSMVASTVLLVTSTLNLAAMLGLAVAVDPAGSLIVIAAVTALAMILRPIRARLKKQASTSVTAGMGLATSLNEISQLGLEVHVFNVQTEVERRVESLIQRNARIGQRLSFLRMLVPTLYTGLAYLVLVGALFAASASSATDLNSLGAVMLVMMRSLSYGQAVQTNSAVLISSVPFVDTLGRELRLYRDGEVSDGHEELTRIDEIDFREVGFEYVPGEPVLTDVSVKIRRGSAVGIVGPSGSGKSTLVQLLLGLRSPTSGSVMFNGLDLGEFTKASLCRRVTFVPQASHLIAGTISDNIRFMRSGVTQADIESAARAAHLHEEITAHPLGYDRVIGESGGDLSGGQAQRLSLARALIERPDVLVLDEPTSALDVRSEALIRSTLSEIRQETTLVIIAHRMSTLEICDEILVVQSGRVVAQGSPSELERTNRFYREALELSGLR